MTLHTNINKAQLEKLYLNSQLSLGKIGNIFNISRSTVERRLKFFNIVKRKPIKMLSMRKIKNNKKYCPRCKKWICLKDYVKNKGTPTGFSGCCKKCLKILSYNWRIKNKDKISVKAKEKYDPVKQKAKNKKYYHENRNKVLILRTNWYKKKVIQEPWYRKYWSMRNRCSKASKVNKKRYYDKDIKPLLTKLQIKELWIKYKANLMVKPELHRLDSNKHYTLDNCIFVPKKFHKKLEGLTITKQKKLINKIIDELIKD